MTYELRAVKLVRFNSVLLDEVPTRTTFRFAHCSSLLQAWRADPNTIDYGEPATEGPLMHDFRAALLDIWAASDHNFGETCDLPSEEV